MDATPHFDPRLLAAFALGLVATLVLAALLTPAPWWRRPNLRAIAFVALGTWGIGTLLAGFIAQPANAQASAAALAHDEPPPASVPAPRAGLRYRVADHLNLRAGRGTGAARVAVVPQGALVTTTGAYDGDWWQVRARIDGRDVEGWSSSLWLRRADE